MASFEFLAIILTGLGLTASITYYAMNLRNQTIALKQSREDYLDKQERERPIVELSIIHADLKLTNIQGGTAHNLTVPLTERDLNKKSTIYPIQIPETFLIYGTPMIMKNNEQFHAPEGEYLVIFSYTEKEIGPRNTSTPEYYPV
jgi:hypothetical protein